MFLTIFCWSKGTSLECTDAESIYVKTTETACVSDELSCFKEEEKEEGERQIMSLGDLRIKRVLDRLATAYQQLE